MTNPYPIPRQTRQTDVLLGNGTAGPYGPFYFEIFDIEDVQVWTKPAGAGDFAEAAVTVIKLDDLPFDFFTVTFAAPLAVTTEYYVRSARLPERSAGVIDGTRINPTAIEKEFSKIATTEQELRRDADQAVAAMITERAARIAGDLALASIIGQAGPIEVPYFDTQTAMGLATVKGGINSLAVGGVFSAGDSPIFTWRRVETEPTHGWKQRTQDRQMPSGISNPTHGGWWEGVPGPAGINLFELGCPVISMVTALPTYEATGAFEIAKTLGQRILLPRSWLDTDPVKFDQPHCKLIGPGNDQCAITARTTTGIPIVPGFWGFASGLEFRNFEIKYGGPGGDYTGPLYFGRYFANDVYSRIENVVIDGIKITPLPGTLVGVNNITLIGNIKGAQVINNETNGGLGGIVCHWGPNNISPQGAPITTNTWHPNDILIRGNKHIGCRLWATFLSATYNVRVEKMTVEDCQFALSVQAGDVGNKYALPEEKGLILSGIHVDGIFGTVVNPTEEPTGSALLWRATGNYVGDWVFTPFLNCSMKNVRLKAKGVTSTAAVCRLRECMRSDIVLENIDIEVDNNATIAYGIDNSSGFKGENIRTNAVNALVYTNAHGELNVNFSGRTLGVGIGVAAVGSRYTNTLAANVAANATTLQVTAGMPVRLFKGDVIRVSVAPWKKATVTADYVAVTDTVIPIEKGNWTANAGDQVYVDATGDVQISGKIEGYATGLSGLNSTSRHITRMLAELEFIRNTVDIDLRNVEFPNFEKMKHAQGGTAYRLERVSNWTIRDCEIGVDGQYAKGIEFIDVNNYNGVCRDNRFGDMTSGPIVGKQLAAAYGSPDRTNSYSGNRLYSGGNVTDSALVP